MSTGWDSYWQNSPNREYWLEPAEQVINLISTLDVSGVKDVLDLGRGVGRHTLYLADHGLNVTALDSSEVALNVLQKFIMDKALPVRIVQGDYSQDIFQAESFDFILEYNVIYHGFRQDLEDTLHLIYKWLRSGGLFFFTCPTRRDSKYGNGEQVAPHTYQSLNSVHPGDIHYFADDTDITELISTFRCISKTTDEHYWDNEGIQQFSSFWQILVRK